MNTIQRFPKGKTVLVAAVWCAATAFATMAFGQGLGIPGLPQQPYGYFQYAVTDVPAHFRVPSPLGPVLPADNTPANNQITNAGATLGRVLFYDARLSHNNTTSCASCHQQATGFSDTRRLSVGFEGGETGRHSMGLSNAKYYQNGRFFWDERAPTLESQVLMPIQDPVEMGMNLSSLVTKLSATSYYPDLFQAAFGSPQITSDRISRALSQFVRSMVSYRSKFDSVFDANGTPNFALLTPQENQGRQLFQTSTCNACHGTVGQIAARPRNNGLDAQITDPGAGGGQFKVPSLRNIEVRGRFMHDGRFASLEEVIQFYSTGIQNNPNLDPVLRGPGGNPIRLNFSQAQINQMLAFLRTLTDNEFLNSPMFSDPFVLPCDFSGDRVCNLADLNALLSEGPVDVGVPVQGSNALYDLTGDGVINNDDVSRWLAIAAESNGFVEPYLVGDANVDGAVDGSDYNAWNAAKFTLHTAWSSGDFNGDGVVDGQDFSRWNANKFQQIGRLLSGSPVPEPIMTAIGLMAGILVARRRP